MGQLRHDGVALAYEEAGSGAPPIMLVHDAGSDHTSLASEFAYFSRTHRVVAVDLRGHGQSEGQRGASAVGELADDLAWLCYELGLYRPVILGHGLGAMVALDLAARCPDLLAAIVVVGPAATYPARPVTAVPFLLSRDLPASALQVGAAQGHATVTWSPLPVLHIHFQAREVALPNHINLLVQEFLSQLEGRAPP